MLVGKKMKNGRFFFNNPDISTHIEKPANTGLWLGGCLYDNLKPSFLPLLIFH